MAPSFGCTTTPYKERLKAAIKNLKNEGFKVKEGKNIFLDKGIVSSNTPKERGKEIMEAFESKADAVISVGGGELMIEMLEYVDFNIY